MPIRSKNKLILASSSPRRAEILRMSGIPFEVRKYPFDENPPDERAEKIPELLALQKADQVKDMKENEIVITADTLVILDGDILGKPKSEQHAVEMLSSLSGRTHQVITGVAIGSKENLQSFSTTTNVSFDEISPEEINHYVSVFKPMDKAGSYGIQEGIGLTRIQKIEGCFYNVMGLPMRDLYNQLNSSFNI